VEVSAPTLSSRDANERGIGCPMAALVPALAMGSADDAAGQRLFKPKRKSHSTTGERHKLPVQTARIVPDSTRSSLVIA